MKVLRELGIHGAVAARLHPFPNGATAMRELANATGTGLIGCTQVTEIKYTDGVELVAALPARFELATTYTAAASAMATDSALAQGFVALLAGPGAHALRVAGGFEV